MTTNLELTRHLVELTRRAGAEQCDAILVAGEEAEVTVRLGKADRVIEAGSRAIGLRVISGGRTAVCSSSDLSEAALERLARDTVELALLSAPDEHAGLPEPATFTRATADRLQLFDERVEALTPDEMLDMAGACEAAGLAADPRITNSDGATVSRRSGEVALVNSLGFSGHYRSTSVSMMVEVMADDADGKKRNAYWYDSQRALHRLASAEEIGRIAARRAVSQLGARKMTTRKVPVVFEPMMAVSLIGMATGAANGDALYRGATFLKGRLGERIASSLLTVTDDATEPGRLGSRPFDGEGSATRRNTIFAEGVFSAFLFDAYSGRRTGNATTGSASRGVASLPSPGTSNLTVQAGMVAAEAIVAEVKDGLYVNSLMGQGFNPTTGDYSRGAAGFWIEDGRLAFPVTEVNISGRMDAILAAIDAVGDDLTWFGSAAAPTLRVREMTVSGS